MKLPSLIMAAGLCGYAVALLELPDSTTTPKQSTTATYNESPSPVINYLTTYEPPEPPINTLELRVKTMSKRSAVTTTLTSAPISKTSSGRQVGPLPLDTPGEEGPPPDDAKFKPTGQGKQDNSPFLKKFWAMTPVLNEYKELCHQLNTHVSKHPMRCKELRNLIAMAQIAEDEFNLPPVGLPKPRGWMKIIIYNLPGRPIGDMPVPVPLLAAERPPVDFPHYSFPDDMWPLVKDLIQGVPMKQSGKVKVLEPRPSEIRILLGEEGEAPMYAERTIRIPLSKDSSVEGKNLTSKMALPMVLLHAREQL